MLRTQSVYQFDQTVKSYSVENNTDKLTIQLDKCSELYVTPKELLYYVNQLYPGLEITTEDTHMIIVELYDLCCDRCVGSKVSFFQLTPNKPCEDQVSPDYLGNGWEVNFLEGKQIALKTVKNGYELLARYTPLVNPITGNLYTHNESGYFFIVGTEGFDKQRTGFIQTNTAFAFNNNDFVNVRGTHSLIFTN